jgi:hypothetical protein
MLKIRVSWDKKPDLTELVNEIHDTFGEQLYLGAVESTPVRSGVTSSSWHQTRTDSNTTEITNDSYAGTYQILSLLHEGTRPHRVGMFWWRAAQAFIRPGLKVSIKPNAIAIHAVESSRGLPEIRQKGERQRYFQAVEFYSYHQDLTKAIEKGTALAVRRMNSK